jgi:hypothetical protein
VRALTLPGVGDGDEHHKLSDMLEIHFVINFERDAVNSVVKMLFVVEVCQNEKE